MEKKELLEEIAFQLQVNYISDLLFSPQKERAQKMFQKIKNEYSEKERKDAEEYLKIQR